MTRNSMISLVAALAVAGCANATTIDRTTTLVGDGDNPKLNGTVIHLDAKQRVAVWKEFGIFCAEPSPDALSTVASSLGAGVSTFSKMERISSPNCSGTA